MIKSPKIIFSVELVSKEDVEFFFDEVLMSVKSGILIYKDDIEKNFGKNKKLRLINIRLNIAETNIPFFE
jgi:hypothetical protein